MKDEIARVLTMVQEGKIDAEKASELIGVLSEKNTTSKSMAGSDYLSKMLKIRVVSESGDNINVNIPLRLVQAVLKTGHSIAEKIPEAEKYVKDINIDLLLDAIENEANGQIVDITYANKDKVVVVIE